MQLTIDTFEDNATVPILSHVFRGDTEEAIMSVLLAHARYDAFFRAAINGQDFNGMRLRNRVEWLP